MSNRWKPNNTYYIIDIAGNVNMYTWYEDDVDTLYHKFGNCFETREQAEAASAKVKELLLSMSGEAGASSAQFPKLTEEVFDYPDCPKWAKWAAVDQSGYAYWFENKPHSAGVDIPVTWILYDRKQLIPGLWDSSDWRNSLIERPKPKLTEEVFNRPDCPKNVQYAVVTSEGRVVGYTSKPYINKEYDCWGFNAGCSFTISVAGTFDPTDWQNSLVERPAKLPDWCKIGGWAYSITEKEYVRIKDIDEFDVEFYNGFYCTVSRKAFVEDYKQARPRPYNEEEMQALVGKVIDTPDGYLFVDAYSKRDSNIHTADGWFAADYLMLAGYTVDREPCHGLEHLEGGKWVK